MDHRFVKNIKKTTLIEPIKLPKKENPQFLNNCLKLTTLEANPIMIRLFPVNSSAPATITRISPREKHKPPISLVMPTGSVESNITIV